MTLRYALPALFALAVTHVPAGAAVIVPDSGDTAWVLAGSLIGLAAVPALVLLAAASFGRAAVPRIMAAVVGGLAAAVLAYVMIGYSLMFDATSIDGVGAVIGGGQHAMLALMGTLREGTAVPETAFVALHLCLAAPAVTLLASALAPIARPGWLLGFIALWFILVLVPVTRWVWGGGWLEQMGLFDGAGGIAVWLPAAVSALLARAMIGGTGFAANADPRLCDAPTTGVPLLGGGALLALGALALAGASTLTAGDDAAVAILVTLIGSAGATLAYALVRRSLKPATLATGLIAGVVGMAVAGDGLSPGGAIVTGALVAVAAAFAPGLLGRRVRALDPGGLVSTIAVVAVAGALCTAVFLSFEAFGGSGYAAGVGMADQLGVQVLGILAVTAWSIVGTAIAALMMAIVIPMRAAAPPA